VSHIEDFIIQMNVIFITLLYISLNLQAFSREVGEIRVTIADVIIIIWLFFGVLYSFRTKIKRVNYYYFIPHLCILIFLVWAGFEAILSPDIASGTTLYLQYIRNFILLLLITMFPFNKKDYQKLNLSIFVVGVIFAVIGIGLYYSNNSNFSIIHSNPERWHGYVGYEMDKIGYLRANGLAGDSNFYAIFLTLSLFCGIGINKHAILKYSGLLLTIIAILLAFSRTIFVALGLTFIVMFSLRLMKLKRLDFIYIFAITLFIIISSIVIFVFFGIDTIEVMRLRFADVTGGNRSYLLSVLLPMIGESPIWGHGLRSAQIELLGYYSHNTYLDVIVDMGLIGMALFSLIILSTLNLMVKVKKDSDVSQIAKPWFFMLIFTLFFSILFSFGTNPFIWLVLSMVVLSYRISVDQQRRKQCRLSAY
jgi:O-antigen ligase